MIVLLHLCSLVFKLKSAFFFAVNIEYEIRSTFFLTFLIFGVDHVKQLQAPILSDQKVNLSLTYQYIIHSSCPRILFIVHRRQELVVRYLEGMNCEDTIKS